MLNLSGISTSNNIQQQQRRNSTMNQLPPVYGNNNNQQQLQQQAITATTTTTTFQQPQNQHHHHHHHVINTNSYAPSEMIIGTSGGGGGGSSSETVFDEEVPVHLKNMDREQVVQSLAVCVQVVKNGPFRTIHLRITDPKDPFFLYTMALAEDDYGRFKEQHQLHVDFGSFPHDLVQMLVASRNNINNNNGDNSTIQQQPNNNSQHFGGGGGGPNDMSTFSTAAVANNNNNSGYQHTTLTFTIANANDSNAIFRIGEKIRLRDVEYLSLTMSRQGDVGQKQYLAERYRFFLRSYQLCENQRANENDHFAKQISDLSMGIEQLRGERDQLRQQNILQASEHKAELASAIDRLRSTSEEHSRGVQSEHEAQISALTKQFQQEQKRNQNEIDSLQSRIQQSAQKIQELEAERLRLSTDLAQKTESLAAATQDGLRLREKVEELSSFKKSATREKNELDLAAVASTERLKHMAELLKNRDEEVSQLRRLGDANEAALRRANDQLDAARKKLDETEQSLAKSHHIIATQLQAQKTFKEKEKALQAQVKSAEKTAQDKTMEYERVKLETSADREKTATLTARVAELKEQLKRAEEQNTNLANDLKQSQEALLHLGRSSSGVGLGGGGAGSAAASLGGSGRMYTSMMAGHGASSRAAAYMNSNNTSVAPTGAATTAANENTNPATNLNLGSGGLSSSTFAPAPITLFREFAKGNNNNNGNVSGVVSPMTMNNNNTSTATGIPSYTSSYAGKYTSGVSNNNISSSVVRPSSSSNNNRADPMSMLRNVAGGGSNNNTPGVTSAYFPSA